MNDSPAKLAARARAHRRKRLQQRQTAIFGSIIAVLLGVAVFAGGVWAEIIPAPLEIELKSPAPEVVPTVSQPCPPEDAMPVAFEDITANVLNSTKTTGLGARTASDLRELGITVETIGNASEQYLGSAKILVGADDLNIAYTVADIFPDSQIVVDARTEDFVDVILGSGFTDIRSSDEFKLDPDQPIPAPEGCIPVPTDAPEDDGAADEGVDDGATDGEGAEGEE